MRKRVLVVDDNKDQVDTLRMLLGLRGYETQGHYDALTEQGLIPQLRTLFDDFVVKPGDPDVLIDLIESGA